MPTPYFCIVERHASLFHHNASFGAQLALMNFQKRSSWKSEGSAGWRSPRLTVISSISKALSDGSSPQILEQVLHSTLAPLPALGLLRPYTVTVHSTDGRNKKLRPLYTLGSRGWQLLYSTGADHHGYRHNFCGVHEEFSLLTTLTSKTDQQKAFLYVSVTQARRDHTFEVTMPSATHQMPSKRLARSQP